MSTGGVWFYLKVTFKLSLTRENVHTVYAKILEILLDVGKCHLQDQLENYIENFFCQSFCNQN